MSEEKENPQWGEPGDAGDGPNIRYDDFVGRIVRDPNAPPSVTLLSGYLGSSSEEGHVRLYLDEELCRYVEIPEKAIRHTQELPPEQSPLGGSLVWIDRDAEVLHGAAGSERRKATFLEGQIAQDYFGGVSGSNLSGGGTTTQTKDCGGAIVATDMGPGCGQSHCGPCIPPTEQVFCRTLTGIFCTRFGPGCRRTVFEPACTSFGPNCHTALVNQCQSVFNPCFTQNKFDCVESGFVGCNPPIDFTIWQEQFGRQPQFAGGAARLAGGGGVFDPGIGVFQTGFNCPSVFDNCATRESFCPTQSFSCPSRLVICNQSQFNRCVTRTPVECGVTRFNCPSRDIPCPTRFEPRCFASQVAICPDTRAGCQVQSAACGFDPPDRGGVAAGGGAQGFAAQAFIAQPTQSPDCAQTQLPACPVGGGALTPTQFCVSQGARCPSAVDACPTRFNCPSAVDACPSRLCPSRTAPCQSQLNRCASALDACPTRFNCPSVNAPCVTQDFSCSTRGACPSAVDACPTRFGCFETQFCGGGGFDPGGF